VHRVRARILLAGSGALLFGSLFRTADTSSPAMLGPHVLGLATATYALIIGPRTLAVALNATRVLLCLVIVNAAIAAITATLAGVVPIAAIFELVPACGFAMLAGFKGGDQARARMLVIALGAAATVWFLFVDAPTMETDRYALAGAVGTVLGGFWWRPEVAVPGVELPRAELR
jgi:hypothetical protein